MSTYVYSSMIGAVINKIDGGKTSSDEMTFYANDGRKFIFKHWQFCCENVSIDDICGDVNDLLNSPILEAEEVSNLDAPKVDYESYTWTFYRFSTAKGSVTVKWLGTSNGYYSESVSFDEEPAEENYTQPVKDNLDMNNSVTEFETQWKRICKKIKALDMGYDINLKYSVEKEKWFINTSINSTVFTSDSITTMLDKYEQLLDNLVLEKKNKLQEELKKFNF